MRSVEKVAEMAKKQRTVQLPEEMYTLAEAFEGYSGVRFNRQMITALLILWFDDSAGNWTEAAVAVERGEINASEVPKWMAQRKLKDLEKRRQLADEDAQIGCPASPEELKELSEGISQATNRIMGWENILRLADDPIDAVLTFWKRVDSGTLPFEITNAPQESLDKFKKKPGEDVQPSN